jgi:hypothetical protein
MSKNFSQRCVFAGAIVLIAALFFIPAFSASISQDLLSNDLRNLSVEKPSSMVTGKPDLIVLNMGFAPYGDNGRDMVACATIKNIGDLKVVEDLYLKYTFTRLIYKTITNIDTTWMYIGGGLKPGAEVYWSLIYEGELPKFGFFEFKCTINPNKTIEESNYDNNELSQKYLAFLGHWKEI